MQHQYLVTPIRLSRVLWFGLLVVMLGGLFEQKAAAQAVSFAPHTDFATGNSSNSVAVGDFNGDGKLDLAVSNSDSNSVSILLGTGTGSFGPRTDFDAGLAPGSGAVGDFNRDGKLDLALTRATGVVSILLGNGDGTFGAETDFVAGNGPSSLVVADFNGDGILDLAMVNGNDNTVSILLGTGTGAFGARTSFGTGPRPNSLAVGDFNGDGSLDLAVTNGLDTTVSILIGTGTGGFGAKTDFGIGGYPSSIAAGDFNGDGNVDLATVNANEANSNLSILLGTGTGSFGASTDFVVGGGFVVGSPPSALAAADFNGDGTLDIVMVNANQNTVSVLPGNGDGNFSPQTNFGTGPAPARLAMGDFDGDGKLDLAVANRGSQFPNPGSVSILLNTTSNVATGVFCQKTDFGSGNLPFSVALGDFNADGKLDLAVANTNSDTVSILLGFGRGAFGAKTDFVTSAGPFAVAVGDFNGDGNLDLATANANSDTVSILLGTGTGTFGTKADFATGGAPRSLAVGDFNGDGNLDLAVANANSSTVSILLGTGTGNFGVKTDFGTGSVPRSIAVGDFNRDGKLDLAVANSNGNSISILLGTGLGTFGAKTDFTSGSAPFSVATADFNNDGKLDLAVSNANSNTVSVLLGTGTGSFGAKTDFGTGSGPFSVVVGDFNRDGKLDLAVANVNGNTVSILPGTGTGTFGSRTDFGTGISPRSVAAGDFNRDGRIDLAVANEISSSVSVLRNTCGNSPPGITATPVTCTAGTVSANHQIAMVSDAVDAQTSLIVTVNGGTSATANGVTVSGISINAIGVVTANVVAICGGTTAHFTLQVTNSSGFVADATLTVTVNPYTGPTIVCPGDMITTTDLNLCSAVVTFAPTVTGICPPEVVSPVCSPASGSVFIKGLTTVTCHVTDGSGNQASCSFTVRVLDHQRPDVSCPGSIVKSTDPSQCSALVTYPPPLVTDNCPGAGASCSPPSGSRFPKGLTVVNCHAADASVNERVCAFSVTVVDAQAPTFATPRSIAATAAASCPYATSKIVTYANPVASDNCTVQSVVCNPPSGSTFPVGTSTVICTATDAAGNIATCSFTVSVFSFCLQDGTTSGNVVLVNASTGDFSFCCNGVPIASGRGILGASGCVGSIDQTKGDRRVHIEWNASANGNTGTGFAYVKKSAGSTVCQITDTQLTNNACQCSTAAPPTIIIAPSPPK